MIRISLSERLSRTTKTILNPFTKKSQLLQNIGGKYGLAGRGVVLEDVSIHDDFTLTPGIDPIYQFLLIYPNDTDINITLDTINAKAGDRFIIKNCSGGNTDFCFVIKEGGATIDKIYAHVIKEFIFDGTEWLGVSLGTNPKDNYQGIGIGEWANPQECAVAIGMRADGHLDGVAIGTSAKGYEYGIGIGYNAEGYDRGVAIGEGAHGHGQGIALGRSCDTDLKFYSIALGYRSKNTRSAELAINIGDEIEDDMRDQLQQIVIGSWIRKTTDATPITMRCAGKAGGEFVVRPQSTLIFKIMVTARDNTTGDCAGYLFDGLIKRDGSNNVTLCASNKTVLHEDDDTWDCSISAGSYAPQITVTGDADNTVRWVARLDGVETSFVAA